MSKPNIITVSRSKRGTSVKARGAAAQVLFGMLTSQFLQQAEPGKALYTIHFEDHQQDFLEWDIDATGLVVDSRPYQALVWTGSRIVGAPYPGSKVTIQTKYDQVSVVNYPVLKITQLLGTEAEQSTGGA